MFIYSGEGFKQSNQIKRPHIYFIYLFTTLHHYNLSVKGINRVLLAQLIEITARSNDKLFFSVVGQGKEN